MLRKWWVRLQNKKLAREVKQTTNQAEEFAVDNLRKTLEALHNSATK